MGVEKMRKQQSRPRVWRSRHRQLIEEMSHWDMLCRAKPGGARMAVQRNEVRNREIFAAHQRGEPIGDLARRYELSRQTVDQIIRAERHKIAVSVDVFYERMRSPKPRLQS